MAHQDGEAMTPGTNVPARAPTRAAPSKRTVLAGAGDGTLTAFVLTGCLVIPSLSGPELMPSASTHVIMGAILLRPKPCRHLLCGCLRQTAFAPCNRLFRTTNARGATPIHSVLGGGTASHARKALVSARRNWRLSVQQTSPLQHPEASRERPGSELTAATT